LFNFFAIHQGNNFLFQLSMAQPSKNKNTCDIFLNEVRMEDEPLLEPKENGNLQIKGSRNPKTNEEKMKDY